MDLLKQNFASQKFLTAMFLINNVVWGLRLRGLRGEDFAATYNKQEYGS